RSAAGKALGRRAPTRGLRPCTADAPAAPSARRAARLARRREEARDFALSWQTPRRGPRAHGLVSHHAPELKRVATSVVLLDGGRVTAAGGMEVLAAATADLMA